VTSVSKSRDHQPESLVIRPPSEWRSLLVRITRGCNWNRCRFCGIYPSMGEPDFSCRSLGEITRDIDVLLKRHPHPESAFFGDADPLAAGMEIFCGAARYLRKRCLLNRLTCYARASTLYKLGRENIIQLAENGLDRIHLGLESGDEEILRFQRKGQSRKMVIAVSRWLKEAGIEISCYVLLGLGGKQRATEHIAATASLLNIIKPQFIRLRRLWLYSNSAKSECPLFAQVRDGSFVEQSPEGTVIEVEQLLKGLEPMPTFFACDHANNYIHVAGSLDQDRDDMLAEVRDFLARPENERQAHYQMIGSRI
jgi:radical SAM superfamily enzyme YgiQ (UPF0313 family)